MEPNGTALQRTDKSAAIEAALVQGDLSKLSTEERISYYTRTCESLELNPLTKPFEYLNLNGKLVLYALKGATDQLRKIQNVSVNIVGREQVGDVYVVTARATLPSGRTDESTGAVAIGKTTGEALANLYMKCETKAKRRVTLSICGLGMLDETEVESIPSAVPFTEGTPVATMPKADAGALEPVVMIVQKWAERFGEAETVEDLDVARAECKAAVTHKPTLDAIAKAYKICKAALEGR